MLKYAYLSLLKIQNFDHFSDLARATF